MTPKEYLEQINNIDRDIQSRVEAKGALENTILQATDYDKIAVKGGLELPYDEKYMPILEKGEEIAERIDQVVALRLEADKRIDRLNNTLYMSILRDKHLVGCSWSELASRYHYTERHLQRLYGQALEEFKKYNSDIF